MADKAFIIGINKYPNAPLKGCVNDAVRMGEFLIAKYNFKRDAIRLLTDERATTSEITTRLKWLVDSKPGDRLLFHFSGHGVQIAARNKAGEVDCLDEAICPVDFNWSPNKMIIDDQLFKIFNQIPVGVKFCWTNDSCHSGDLTRDMPLPVAKKKQLIIPRRYPSIACEEWKRQIAVEKGFRSRAVHYNKLNVGFISGCQSEQTSADTIVDGQPHGAMTYYFLKVLTNMLDKPLFKVVSATTKELARNGYSQHPICDGARRAQPFLS